MNEELKQKLTERFEAISAKAECDNEVRDALLKAYLAGGEYGYQYTLQQPQWIPVEEELPEKDNEFEDYSKLVIVTNGKDFWKGMYNYGGEDWLTFDLWPIDDATHWMPIVPPRKEDK